MPAFFQIKFHAVRHPKTGAPWFVPDAHVVESPPFKPTIDITQEVDSFENESEEPEAHLEPETNEGETSPPKQPTSPPKQPTPPPKQPAPGPDGSGAYMLARQSLLHTLSQKSLTNRGEIVRILPPRWKQSPYLRHEITVWREDMPTYYLNILRKTLLGKLKYLRHRNAGYLVAGYRGLDGIQKTTSLGAVLWFGDAPRHSHRGTTAAVKGEPTSGAFPPEGPQPYLMVKYKKHHVPVYNMRAMLGDELLRGLREEDQLFDREFVVLKAKANTVKTRMVLWKLQIYTAYFQAEGTDPVGRMGPASKKRGTVGERRRTHDADGGEVLGVERDA